MRAAIEMLAAATAISLGTFPSADVLEPSVLNEVEHAIGRAPTNVVARAEYRPAWTNGLDATAIAIRLVSEQKSDGRWLDGTNDVTSAAVRILKQVGGLQ